jgi:hypothetical protein
MCEFPSKALLKLSRHVAKQADASDDPGVLRSACEFIRTVQELRLLHEDLTQCQCWYEAVKEANA